MIDLILSDYPLVVIFLAGCFGALSADIIKDNCLEFPYFSGGRFFLGFIGGAVIGGFAGVFIDGSFITAFLGGFAGKDIILALASKPKGLL